MIIHPAIPNQGQQLLRGITDLQPVAAEIHIRARVLKIQEPEIQITRIHAPLKVPGRHQAEPGQPTADPHPVAQVRADLHQAQVRVTADLPAAAQVTAVHPGQPAAVRQDQAVVQATAAVQVQGHPAEAIAEVPVQEVQDHLRQEAAVQVLQDPLLHLPAEAGNIIC